MIFLRMAIVVFPVRRAALRALPVFFAVALTCATQVQSAGSGVF